MKTRLANTWEALHDSYWFIPLLMVIASMATAVFLLLLDRRYNIRVLQVGGISLIYSGGVDSARNLLADIAAAIITIAGVSFSITIVTLSLAAAEYGPRLLRHYMRNTGNQVILGTFVSTFTYCLLVYAQTPDKGVWDNPPRVAVSFGIILAVACIGVFIYFIHHMSEFIRVDVIITAAFHELLYCIDRLYPEELGLDSRQVEDDSISPQLPPDFDSNVKAISSVNSAYLQAIESETLMKLASEHDLLIQLLCRPGDFLIRNCPIAQVYPAQRIDSGLENQLIKAFILGIQRTPEQDVEFAIYEIVEIALRALSPSLNDPFTAMSCLDRLTAGLTKLMERRFPSSARYDAEHKLRVLAKTASFDEYVEAAIGPIYRNGKSHALVTRCLDKCLHIAIDHARTEAQRKPLQAQLELLKQAQ